MDSLKQGLFEHWLEAAYDGSAGRKLFETNHFDLVILNINLPSMNGYDLCKKIRNRNPLIPAVILIAMGTTDDKIEGFDAGVVENGCKYSRDHTSRVALSFGDNSTFIEVRSFSEGISSLEHEQRFRPFYRSANAAATSGFGLGLALAKHIVGLHKGSISLQTLVTDETVFGITLPTLGKETNKG